MIVYRVLRAFGRLALRWFYRDIEVLGIERIPAHGPALLASNHPNALVDALVIACTLRRPVTLTAKATLLSHPLTRALVRATGVVPLQRASDATRPGEQLDPGRNAGAFASVLDALARGGLVLLFPEGKSHSDPALAPLKTGLARIAVMAREERSECNIPIIPIGLTFERKWEPRSRVLMRVGTPIHPEGCAAAPNGVEVLTRRVEMGLREVTLNFETADEAGRILSVSSVLAEVLDEFRPLATPDPPLADMVRLAHRLSEIAPSLAELDASLGLRIATFLARFSAFDALTSTMRIAAGDVQMSRSTGPGFWFGLRELAIAIVGGPFALWGRVNHWVPLRIARTVANAVSRTPDEPAMNTIVVGVVIVMAFYAVQIGLVAWWLGWVPAAIYGVSLPLSATWDFRYTDRLRRAIARIRAYLRFRRAPQLHDQLLADLAWLRSETIALDSLVAEAFSEKGSHGPAGRASAGSLTILG
jgi:1-acyl-sn-glycerol-3-phosphate acyltransferase